MGATKTDHYTEEQLTLAALCKALGHPARIAILQQLVSAGCCIGKDFGEEIALSQPTLSQHLRELRQAGLIEATSQGNRVEYRIVPTYWQTVANQIGAFFTAGGGCC